MSPTNDPAQKSVGYWHPKEPSKSGFDDYEETKKNFEIEVPEYFNFVGDTIQSWADKEETGERGTLPAYWWNDEDGSEIKWSYRDLINISKKSANMLNNLGLEKGDRIVLIISRLPSWWISCLGAIRSGVQFSPGTVLLKSKDIKYRLNLAKVKAIIVEEQVCAAVDEIAADCPHLMHKIVVNPGGALKPGWQYFYDLYDSASADHQCVKTRSDETMTLFYTSGTTGMPKITEHTYASFGLGHVISSKFWLDCSPNDIVWNLSDPGWVKCAYAGLYGTWISGGCVFIHNMKCFNVKQILKTLSDFPVSTLCSPPTAFRMMVQEDLSQYNFDHLNYVISGGEPLNPEVMESWRKATGTVIRDSYAQTETTMLCAMFTCIEIKPGSMGKPSPGVNLAIIDEHGETVPPYTEGEIGVRVKPHRPVGLFKCYMDDEARTDAVYVGDYYRTGDRGYVDEDGYFFFIGRKDDVIITAGYRIGPFEVESALMEHPSVVECAVVSSPHELRGEVVKAFVILSSRYKEADKEELIKQLQTHVKSVTAPYKYPRKIEFVEELPKTPSGKIRRIELRNKEWDQVIN